MDIILELSVLNNIYTYICYKSRSYFIYIFIYVYYIFISTQIVFLFLRLDMDEPINIWNLNYWKNNAELNNITQERRVFCKQYKVYFIKGKEQNIQENITVAENYIIEWLILWLIL